MKSNKKKTPTLPKTKISKTTGLNQVTATGYFLNKNGKVLPLQVVRNNK